MPREVLRSPLVERVLSTLHSHLLALDRGGRLPPEAELAAKLGVARKTVRSALAVLEKEGLIRRIRGKGTFPACGPRARSLLRRSPMRIGLVSATGVTASDPGRNTFYSAIFVGILEETIACRGELLLSGGDTTDARREACYSLAEDPQVQGVILIAVTDQEFLADVAQRDKPVCLVDHYSERVPMDCVRVDSFAGAKMAVEHVYHLGHRHIAYFQPHIPGTNPMRLEGYKAGLTTWGLDYRPEWVVSAPTTIEGGDKATMQILNLPEDRRPTAIVAFSDEMALGAIQAIMKFGLAVPKDFSVVGVGGTEPVPTIGLPELTSVRFDSMQMGRLAVRHLCERMSNPGIEPRNTVINASLHVGQSSGPYTRR